MTVMNKNTKRADIAEIILVFVSDCLFISLLSISLSFWFISSPLSTSYLVSLVV